MHIKKQRHYQHYNVVKAMIFPVVMYGCESWTIRKLSAEELVGWHQLLDEHELGQASGDGDGQIYLAYNSSWGHKESDTTVCG